MAHNKFIYKLLAFSVLAISCNASAYQTLTSHDSLSGKQENVNHAKKDVKKNWSVKKGQNLYGILSEWAVSNGWEIVWETKNNYIVNASAEFKNMSIDNAIQTLLLSMGDVQPRVFVRIFDGNRVILVKSGSGI
ncbi:lipoprotein [Escherichia coli]|uniref:TcpQ domain-containing protein n=1 Tax=Escherichia coli TaxID=562 RepID=UPI00191AA798|nr:TcpQ domain-containing protein [Escherichia coli]CAD6176269.1 lipoprotein [Escherichia coli]